MTASFSAAVKRLQATSVAFDPGSIRRAELELSRLRTRPLAATKALIAYHDLLLFVLAHPTSLRIRSLADRELHRIARFMRGRRIVRGPLSSAVGMPYVSNTARFTLDCVRWLLQHPHCRVTFEEFADATLDLNTVARLTLPPVERSLTNLGLSNDVLLRALGVRSTGVLRFLVAELSRLEATPDLKDHLFDALGVMIRITPARAAFSSAFNRLPIAAPVLSTDRLKDIDPISLGNQALPPARRLDRHQQADVVRVLRDTMTLTSRETDPATYMDEQSLRVFDLERGLSIAVFGMIPARQLALESYVGFTVFRNGMPVSYGGAWMFGPRADFGMNIFEPYRGGESGYVMCQLLRVYRQLFGVRYFEVDAHQFGLDNPDGIASGAFWFYYRYGFRPTDRTIASLARREKARLRAAPGTRTSRATLVRFTDSNVALSYGGPVPTPLSDVTDRITRMVQRRYDGDRLRAETDSVQRLCDATGTTAPQDPEVRAALTELALMANALGTRRTPRLRVLVDAAAAKPSDVFVYQQKLSEFLTT
ncbi:MAG: hypothetical protein IT353_17555 [Gemmatimonadaceae bacterium]|nr:hypothetical protein [Gemmatimonadaceae bacterium]